jgi:ubiquitin C-terminal hydrolase
VVKFHAQALSFHPEWATEYADLLPQLVEMAFSRSEETRQAALFSLIAEISRGGDELRNQTISLVPNFKTFEFDHWKYTPLADLENRPYRGLRNLGTTCYFNCLFQQLFFCSSFRELLFREPNLSGVGLALRRLFAELALSSALVVDTAPFASAWSAEVGPDWSPTRQEDAYEFLQRLLERLPKTVQSPFCGKMKTVFEGISQTFRKEIIENFSLLSIPVLKCPTFARSMATLTGPVTHSGQNQYHDDELGKIDVRRDSTIIELPHTLILQLKRFEYDVTTLLPIILRVMMLRSN